ncbi:MAG: phage major capsid protein [Eubacterium sp.]|nr:phage major capsid protein [Eubacterium sp.]
MSFDNIKLEKGLYSTSKGFTASLEELDPSENYKGTEYEGLDAYQRQLKRFDIKVSGKNSDTISKFFQTSDSAALFPEYISRAVRQGLEGEDILDKIVAVTTEIDALDYRSVACDPDENNYRAGDIAEGSFIPETVIKTKEELTPLKKRGRMLVASYESLKFQKLDMFTVMLSKIGNSIAKEFLCDAMKVIEAEGPEQVHDTVVEYDYDCLVDMYTAFKNYNLTTFLCPPEVYTGILKLSEFRDANAGLNFHATGSPITPLGAELVCVNGYEMENDIVAIDKNYALEKVQAGGIITDYDKLIDRQLERATVSSICGFSRIFEDAVKFV